MHRYEDSSLTPSSSKDTTNIDSKYLINTLKKYLSISVKYCRGITDCTDWFTKDIFGCNRFTCEWINNGKSIVNDAGFYFNPFKFGEAIVELLFSKLRSSGKAVAKDYATGIAQQNASLHRKRVAFNNKKK
eukprot:471540_1